MLKPDVYAKSDETRGSIMAELMEKLANKSISTGELFRFVERDSTLLPQLLGGLSSSKASIRYGCAKVLTDLSDVHPAELYPFTNSFVSLLESKYRILVWNALAIIANLAKVDKDKKLDAAFERYFDLLNDGYMVTVANVVGNSSKIALAKPYLADKITDELLKVDHITLTPHLTEECRKVIAEKAIMSFDLFFSGINQKKRVISFVERHTGSSRATLRAVAENFLKKHLEKNRVRAQE